MSHVRVEDAVRAIGSALSRAAREYRPRVRVRSEGRVLGITDGVLRIEGLPDACSEELLEVGGHAGRALVLSLQPSTIEAIALDDDVEITDGAAVRATGRAPTLPAGDAMLGRVVDPLGRPLDGMPLRGTLTHVPLERRAPRIFERTAVHSPLYTGALAIDAMFPIGRGQRELIVGEEGTGKTSLALDILLRQKNTEVVCVYVAVGRRRSETWHAVEALRAGGERWIVVAAPDDDSPGMRYLAPYAGTALAEHFTYRGEHALIVYDDLTSHAVAWRELSLLLKRPPGREAYPGDIFYLHSRLLERAAQLSMDQGGGSLTALPLAVLEGGRLTSYIPTNLISITDGQIVLSRSLFTGGQKPAIDASLSVSRVGAKAQAQAFRELAARLRLDYAGFLELEAFSRLGTRLEATTEQRIALGKRIRLLLRGGRLEPLGIFAEVAYLTLAASHDALLALPETEVAATARQLVDEARRELPELVARVERDAVLSQVDRDSLEGLLRRVVAARAAAAGPEIEVTFEDAGEIEVDIGGAELDG